MAKVVIKQFQANFLFLHPLSSSHAPPKETLVNLWFPDFFMGYQDGTMVWNGSTS